MAGTFPGVANSQQNDLNGRPLVGGALSVFNGGTNVLATLYQDIGLALPQANPLALDASGRVPMFFVADGTYRVRLVDQYGSTSNGGFDYPQVPSIGASSSGGGGSAVDPTTVASTGDVKHRLTSEILTGWVRLNGKTIGSAISGGSERANADCQSLFAYLWSNFTDAQCAVSGGRGASATADWGTNKTITLPNMQGRALIGIDGMGGVTANILASVTFSLGDHLTPYSLGGEALHQISALESAKLTYTVTTIDAQVYVQNGFGNGWDPSTIAAGGLGTSGYHLGTFGQFIGTVASPSIGVSDNAGGQPHNNMQPFATSTIYMKL